MPDTFQVFNSTYINADVNEVKRVAVGDGSVDVSYEDHNGDDQHSDLEAGDSIVISHPVTLNGDASVIVETITDEDVKVDIDGSSKKSSKKPAAKKQADKSNDRQVDA